MLGQRRRGGDLGLILLFIEIARVGVDHIPPVTLAALALNVGIHLFSPFHLNIHDVCVGAVYVVHELQLARLLLSSVYHLHDFHLYYNMTSLIWKGRRLEPMIGSWVFGWLILLFAVGTSCLMVASSYIMMQFFDYPKPFFTCAAGFSGVLFALKVVVNQLDPGAHGYIMGIPIEIRYLAWAELALVSLMFPESSFLGHLCGIAMGYAYIYGFLNPIFAVLNYVKERLTEDTVRVYAQPAQNFNYASATGHTNNNANRNNNPNNTNNTNNTSNSTSNNTNTNTNNTNDTNTNNEEYSPLGAGFYNRYRNYDYNQQGGGGGEGRTGAASSGAAAARSRTVVNGWVERSNY